MAALSSFTDTFLLGLRRSNAPTGTPPISMLQPRANVLPIRHSFRLRNDVGVYLPAKQRVPAVFASGINPPDPDTGKSKADRSSSGAAEGPPLLTILAGILVLLLICWVVGSIVMWLIGLIVNVPPS